jgi:hypothetical protein
MAGFDRPDTVLLEITPQEWMLWQHGPITAAFLQFQDDQIAVWRELAADLLEAGAFHSGETHEDRNPDVVRGKLIAMRNLRGITLEAIQGFYGKEPAEAEEET